MLAADAGEDHVTDAVSADLASQIHLDGGIDGHSVRVLTDTLRIVRPAHIVEHRVLVVVEVLVHMSGTKGQTCDTAAGLNLLQRIVNHARLHQTEHPVGHRLGVQAEMLVVLEAVQNGVRNAADTYL